MVLFAITMVVLEAVGLAGAIVDREWGVAGFLLAITLLWGWILSKEIEKRRTEKTR